jgi:hypothetical protein
MNGMQLIRVAALLMMAAALPGRLEAGANYLNNQSNWSRSDKCSRNAIVKFPDQTSQALAEREKYVRKCNLANNTPAREPLVQPRQESDMH